MQAVDTLGAGDVFHGGFALALAEGKDEIAAMRFCGAAAGLKCTRLGGSARAPYRAEVETLLASLLSCDRLERRRAAPDYPPGSSCAPPRPAPTSATG